MRKLIPFKLDPILREDYNPTTQCADCGKEIRTRNARIVMTNISQRTKGRAEKEVSLNELARNIVWAFLCQECWQLEHRDNPESPVQ